eukprot:m.60116 g.60116  ORF g.60116 m.60116 type:complete len:230 (+) comp11354_c0_seq1:172-861(+)
MMFGSFGRMIARPLCSRGHFLSSCRVTLCTSSRISVSSPSATSPPPSTPPKFDGDEEKEDELPFPIRPTRRLSYSPPFHINEKFRNEYPVWVEQIIDWGDMDAFNHVNNCVYFRYFENARIEYMLALCEIARVDFVKTTGIGPIMADASCRFRFPVTYPDTLTIAIRAEDITDSDLNLSFKMFSERHRCLVAEGKGRLVCYDFPNARKTQFPEVMMNAILNLNSMRPST